MKRVIALLFLIALAGTARLAVAQVGPMGNTNPPPIWTNPPPVWTNHPPEMTNPPPIWTNPPPMWTNHPPADWTNGMPPGDWTNNPPHFGTNCPPPPPPPIWTNMPPPPVWTNRDTHVLPPQGPPMGPPHRDLAPLPTDVQASIQQFQQNRTALMSQLRTATDAQRAAILQQLSQLRDQLRDQMNNLRQQAQDQAQQMQTRFGNGRDQLLNQGAAGNSGSSTTPGRGRQ